MQSRQHHNTIVAIATPRGTGGVGMVRISGHEALPMLARVFIPKHEISTFKPRHAYFGCLSKNGVKWDDVIVIYFKSPHSFTGEDVVEIYCHGGAFLTSKILELVLEQGAKPARGGEFTERAFFNGKLDLLQAEGIEDLIMAESENAIKLANDLLSGHLTRWVQDIKDIIIELACGFEAEIEFPDEGDVQDNIHTVLHSRIAVLEKLISTLTQCVDRFEKGLLMREGISIVLVGAPNVGKSTLMNQILGYQRALVSDIPGTTRDYIREKFYLKGLPVHLVDLAGIRENPDTLEKHGIDKAGEWIEKAQLGIFIMDASRSVHSDDIKALDSIREKLPVVFVKNKCDLPSHDQVIQDGRLNTQNWLEVSAQTGSGVQVLLQHIEIMLCEKADLQQDELLITHERHKHALTECLFSLKTVKDSLLCHKGAEILAYELRQGLKHLELMTGEVTSDEIMHSVFSRFCVGK